MVMWTIEETNCNSSAEKQMLIHKRYRVSQGRDKEQNRDNEKLIRASRSQTKPTIPLL